MTTILDQPPTNRDAELAILGAMMAAPFGMRVAVEALEPDDFASPQHQALFRTMRAMHVDGIEPDLRTIVDTLRRERVKDPNRRGEEIDGLTFVGGAGYIARLSENTPVAANARAYAAEVRKVATYRRLVEAGHQTASLGYEQQIDPARSIDEAAARIIEVRDAFDRREDNGLRTGESFAGWYVSQFTKGVTAPRIPWPIAKLDEKTSGGQAAGWVVVTGGYSNEGKSWWGLDTMESFLLADDEGRGLYISGEMPRDELWERLTAMGTPGTPYSDLQERRREAYIAAEDRVHWIGDLKDRLVVVDDDVSVDRLASLLATERMRGRPYRYVVIDHLTLMEFPAGRDDTRVKLNWMLKRLKRLAIRFGCTIHILSQLKRPAGGASQVPTMHDFKETGDIENIADVALLLHRDRDGNGDPGRLGTLRVGKNRAGAFRGPISVEFEALRFRERPGFVAGGGLAENVQRQQQRAPRVVA